MMTVIEVFSTKGGAGKSTVTAQIAVAAHTDSKRNRLLIIDCDEHQKSIKMWGEALRTAERPDIWTANEANLVEVLEEAERQGYTLVIIDVPPSGGPMVTRIASLADHIVIPVRPSAFDIHAMRQTVDLLRLTVDDSKPHEMACASALGKAVVVLNAMPHRPAASVMEDMERALDKCGAGGVPFVVSLSDRAAYKNSIGSGKGVLEMSGDETAKSEVNALYGKIKRIMSKRQTAIRKLKG